MFGSAAKRSGSADRGNVRSRSMERGRQSHARASETGRARAGSTESERPGIRTARSSVIDVAVQRAPDFRGEKNKNIQELIGFIKEWEIENSDLYTMKTLQCPTTKVFLGIATFLIQLLMPGHQIADRHEDEIPYIFKTLGYPFIITRSAVLSIAPHSWPQLCHALVWLTRGIAEVLNTHMEPPDFLEYVINVMEKPDQRYSLEQEMKSSILGSHRITHQQLEEHLAATCRKCEQLENEVGNADELLVGITEQEKNAKVMAEYMEATSKWMEPKLEMVEKLGLTIQSHTAMLAENKATREKLESENNQRLAELTPEERSSMQVQQRNLLEKKKSLVVSIEEKDQECCVLQIRSSKEMKELEELVKSFNDMASKHMDMSVADDLRLTHDIESKVSSIVEPYLAKTYEDLLNYKPLQELQDTKQKLSSNLKISKAELDQARQKLYEQQERDRASLQSLTNRHQVTQEKYRKLLEELKKLSKEKECSEAGLQMLKENIVAARQQLNQLKEKNEAEEEERVAALKSAYAQYEEEKLAYQLQLDKQILELQDCKRKLRILKAKCISCDLKMKQHSLDG
ncbi:kinetochore protein NDC80 homolog [Watersipora subatra]|uniref:kinetochore protein NDC80 homolog n=1 Tax=Watersipora subatra TaxID=2589382 RepID=UPI00355B3F66